MRRPRRWVGRQAGCWAPGRRGCGCGRRGGGDMPRSRDDGSRRCRPLPGRGRAADTPGPRPQLGDLDRLVLPVVSGQDGGEVGGGLIRGEQTDLDPAPTIISQGGILPAGGDQHPPRRPFGRPQPAHVGRVGQVVENDKPPFLGAAQPGQQPIRGCGWIRLVGAWDLDRCGGIGVGGLNAVTAACGHPHQQIHRPGIQDPVSVVGGELGLADPAHAGQYLAPHLRPTLDHRLVQEVDIAPVLEAGRCPGYHPYDAGRLRCPVGS